MRKNKIMSIISGLTGIILGGILIFNPDRDLSVTFVVILGVIFLVQGVRELAPVLWEKIQ